MTRYRIDPARSRVWIDARSNVHPIRSEASGLGGWLELDASDGTVAADPPPRGHLELPVSKLTSGNTMEDRELQRRIDARRYPTIAGDLQSMAASNGSSGLQVRGSLTFRGVTREYEDTMTFAVGSDGTVTLGGQATFDIRDFGMEPPRILLLKVRPDVTVRVEIVAAVDEDGTA